MLQACASAAQQAPQSQVQLRDDQFRPYLEYTTGQVLGGSYPNLVGLELNGRIDRRSGALATLLSVEFAYVGLHKT